MNSLQKTFLSMIRTALWDTPFICEDGVKAADLFHEACRYEIAGVLYTKLDMFCQEDVNTRVGWTRKAMSDYQKSSDVLSAQTALCKILSEENVKPVFLKGMASAFYYPVPLLRQIGDIDFIVLPEQFEACCRLLEQNGYVKGIDGERHLAFEKQGLQYECHRYFSFNMTDADKREEQIIYDGCRNCVTRSVENSGFYALPDAEYGIVLLEHLKHHLADGVGFRQIIDWVVYVDALLDDELWNSVFQKMAEQCGLERLAKTLTGMAQIYLGLKTDGISWASDIDESVCSALIELIFSCNNFGYIMENDEMAHKAGTILRSNILVSFHAHALYHLPFTRKRAYLWPLAWTYQIIRWCINGIIFFIFRKKKTGWSAKKTADQKKFLQQLGI